MRKLRVLVMMDEGLIPPDSLDGLPAERALELKTEFDVCSTLASLGHAVRKVPVKTELESLERALIDFDPHICFNLLEDFAGISTRDAHVVSYLELLNRPYTGSNPRFYVFPLNRSPK